MEAASTWSSVEPGPPGYRPRHPDATVLHQLVYEHLETFLAEARARGDGDGLPRFVERELREFLTCGQLARGFARFRCDPRKRDLLVAFSCKGRGFCPSCTGRRMATLAMHLVDEVLGGLPVRQWVLTLPHRLRYALAWDHRLCRAVLGVFIHALFRFETRRARRRGLPKAETGAVTAIQRFGSALNLNVHFHTLAVQGVFACDPSGALRFVALPEPSGADVERVLAQVRRRVVRLVRRQGDGQGVEAERLDPQAAESPVLAGLASASVAGLSAVGATAGRKPVRLGAVRVIDDTDAEGARGPPTSAASISTLRLRRPPATADGSSICVATCCGRRSLTGRSSGSPAARFCCTSGAPGATARARSSRSRCWRASPR